MSGLGSSYEKVISQADDVADRILRHSKHYLPHLARLCLVSTFIEDGLRMWFQWNEQRDYMSLTWHCGNFLAVLFVVVNMVAQLGGCAMVLLRKHVPVAVGVLFGVIVLQVRGHSHTHTHTHTHTHSLTHTHMHIHTHTHTHMHIHIHTYTCTPLH